MHPFRDGAPFLLLVETPPAIGRSLRCFLILHYVCVGGGRLACYAVNEGKKRLRPSRQGTVSLQFIRSSINSRISRTPSYSSSVKLNGKRFLGVLTVCAGGEAAAAGDRGLPGEEHPGGASGVEHYYAGGREARQDDEVRKTCEYCRASYAG